MCRQLLPRLQTTWYTTDRRLRWFHAARHRESPKQETHTRSALLKCEVTGEACSHGGLRDKMRRRRTSGEAETKSRREWWSVTVGTLEANLSEEDPGKHQLLRDWTRRSWKYLHFEVIMLFGTYGAWLKESVVPVVNLIRLPNTFSSSQNDVCHDFTEKKKEETNVSLLCWSKTQWRRDGMFV